jgi:Cu-processing system ATP-binding protein
MIQFSHIDKRYGRMAVLKDINLSLAPGRSIALIGPNGSGKTTLLKCLLGMVVPDRGEILLDGQRIAGDWAYRAKLGYMPQTGRYPENMTIAQVFGLMKELRQVPEGGLDQELIGAFGLTNISDKRMRTLSGGTRQKVSASLAFLFDPAVIVLDEPTAGLDPVASRILTEKIQREVGCGKLVLITSHILSELDDLVGEVVYLQEGSVRFHKTISQLQADTGERKLVRAIARVMEDAIP